MHPRHRASSFSDATGACLVWVKDDGTYFMADGLRWLVLEVSKDSVALSCSD
ncbi:hypothetical protein ABT263_35875 [Kitasatospora sp. NPDC001603]|uniref:hypothetical protein n=1 Tax=Kitasatospora sp. NPDC001603 TaxID=3154388 RepID=UPI003323986E